MKKIKNYTVIHILVMTLAIIVGAGFMNSTVYDIKTYYLDTHANFVHEYATIVRYETVHNRYQGYTYSTFYEYEADDVVYYGLWQRLIENEEDAKEQIGKKVPIYVDHALKRHRKNLDISIIPALVGCIFPLGCFLIFLNSFVRETIFIVRCKKRKKAINSSNKESANDA